MPTYTETEIRDMMSERQAIIAVPNHKDAEAYLETVQAYLPTNYRAKIINVDAQAIASGRVTETHRVLVHGHDDHGWTLDGYVVPRLASGLIAATILDDGDDEVEPADLTSEQIELELREQPDAEREAELRNELSSRHW